MTNDLVFFGKWLSTIMWFLSAISFGCVVFHVWAAFHGHPEFIAFAVIFAFIATMTALLASFIWKESKA